MKQSNEAEKIETYLKRFQLHAIFNEQLIPRLSLRQFEVGERICSQGDESDYLFVLVKGKVKISTTSREGKNLILGFKTPVEVIGDIEYVRGTTILNTVEAVTAVEMLVVTRRDVDQFAGDDPNLLRFLLQIITQKFYIKSNALSFNLMYPVEVRLASYLLSSAFDDANSNVHQELKTSILPDAADLIGTSYRHVNRVIQRFTEEGIIRRDNGVMTILNRKKLEQLANNNIYE
ncbi:Crp/Fnr family transcriptional regulator [Paenisporosarcina cavernae]|uniref:Crp/Fnr family transcriptional regulator n=1 Tax=Paenisporosarcina cavernae TaxID=2320858 RepID=A0A385YVC8_9BACL|nr:cyclic nucleotide-binding domain-containing protein [Paenisporosarcina cavernae]AYC30504.1 Crp/Fnr family transcriptional regulator [Paenisporosarcina cavernae]